MFETLDLPAFKVFLTYWSDLHITLKQVLTEERVGPLDVVIVASTGGTMGLPE